MDAKHKELNDVVKQFFDQFVKQAEDDSDTNLQHMNEDCLREIFSKQSLDLMDLCSIAETCKRFKEITQRLVSKKFCFRAYDYIQHAYRCDDKVDVMYSGSIKEIQNGIERVLKNFGSAITSVSILTVEDPFRYGGCDCCEPSEEEKQMTSDALQLVWNLVQRHCADSLESLEIDPFDRLTIEIKPFKRLQQLVLFNVSIIEGDMSVFADCNELVELSIKWVEGCSAILENHFPKLERFIYEKSPFISSEKPPCFLETLTAFIVRHSTLKLLHLVTDCDDNSKMTILQAINSCNELMELKIHISEMTVTSLQPLQGLKSIRSLELWTVSFDDFELLSSWPQLRELNLIWCTLPVNPKHFATLIQCTKLELSMLAFTDSNNHLDGSYVTGIISRLVNLNELIISSRRSFKLDEETFSEIVAIVKGRPMNVLTLECEYNSKRLENQNVKLRRPLRRPLGRPT